MSICAGTELHSTPETALFAGHLQFHISRQSRGADKALHLKKSHGQLFLLLLGRLTNLDEFSQEYLWRLKWKLGDDISA